MQDDHSLTFYFLHIWKCFITCSLQKLMLKCLKATGHYTSVPGNGNQLKMPIHVTKHLAGPRQRLLQAVDSIPVRNASFSCQECQFFLTIGKNLVCFPSVKYVSIFTISGKYLAEDRDKMFWPDLFYLEIYWPEQIT